MHETMRHLVRRNMQRLTVEIEEDLPDDVGIEVAAALVTEVPIEGGACEVGTAWVVC